MGYLERQNLNSKWNKKRVMNSQPSTQTTQKENYQVTTREIGEPVVLELSVKRIWEMLCNRLKRKAQSPVLTN